MELVDEAHLHAAHARLLVVGELAALDAVDDHGALVGTLEQPGDMEKRRLAGAGRPEQSDRLAGKERGRRALQHLDAAVPLRVATLEALEAELRLRFRAIHLRPYS